MASAALAFKCLEVAYMKVIYSSHSSAGRDRHELQTALQMVPPGKLNFIFAALVLKKAQSSYNIFFLITYLPFSVGFLSGESPSSSASDVDNLNNPSTADKVPLPKGVSSPQVAGNHVIAARNRPNFVRMLKFVSFH